MNASDKPFLPRRESFLDCTGRLREFELAQGPQTDGALMRAHEVAPDGPPGYEFEAWAAVRSEALGRLRDKIRDGLSRRYLAEHPDRGLEMLSDRLAGRVGHGGVTVDGRPVSWDWLITLLQTYEGRQIEVVIKDPAE